MKPIVIIGSGLAGYTLAKEFRKLDTQTPLVIVTAREGNFYSKPQLSTALSLERHPTDLVTVSAKDMAEQLNATLHTHTEVIAVDAEQCEVVCQDELRIGYSKLVLAIGSDVIRPPLQGNAIDRVLTVNDLEDYHLFREHIQDKKRVVILGAGLVGVEFANDLSNAGYEVSVVAPATHPVDRLVPDLVGYELKKALEANGVSWHLESLPQSVNEVNGALHVSLNNGKTLVTDVVMSAIGIHPRKKLAEQIGLRTNRGVLVNRYLQTSDPNMFALGDCAEVNGVVLFFVAPLLQCARSLAKTLAGTPTIVHYPAMPVALKTSVCPVVVQPPAQDIAGEWHFDRDEEGVIAKFIGEDNQLYGFVLTMKKVKERAKLTKDIPPLFADEV